MRSRQDHFNLINETVEYYKTNPRGRKEGSGCYYRVEQTGAKCAVGRCFKDDVPDEIWDFEDGVDRLEETFSLPLDDLLKEEYHGFDLDFWLLIQGIHDFLSSPTSVRLALEWIIRNVPAQITDVEFETGEG